MAVVGLGTFIVACTCATLGLMSSLSFLVFHIYHRRNKIVKMSSPYLNMLTSIGAFLLSVVCFLYGLDFILEQKERTLTFLCQIRIWVLVTSITLILGPACTKAWRVHSIFKYGFAKRVVIKDSKLVGIIAGLLLVDIVLMSLWQTINPVISKTKIYVEEELKENESAWFTLNDTETVTECTCSKLPVWIAVLSLWKIALMVACLVFAWKTRNVTVPCLNDALNIFSGIFVIVMVAFIATVISTTVQRKTDAVYIIVSIAIATSAITFQMILFLPRVRHWWKTPDDISPRISSSSLREIASAEIPRFGPEDYNANTYQNDALGNIVEENKLLRQSLLEKDGMISELQSHLDIAKEKLSDVPKCIEYESDLAEDIYDTLRSPEHSQDRSTLYRVQGTPRSARSETNDTTESRTHSDSDRCHQTNLKYVESQSVQSIDSKRSFVAEFFDLTKSIATELESATQINSGLRKSYSADVHGPFSETEWLCETSGQQELAGSIAESYSLGDSKDTENYIQSFLPVEKSVFQIKRSHSISSTSARSMASSENMSTVNADFDTINREIPPFSGGAGTPNSQQHAELLRYYSYRHLNGGLKQFRTYRVNRDCRPSFRFKKNIQNRTKLNVTRLNGSVKVGSDAPVRDNPAAIYSVPNVVQKPPRLFRDIDWAPKDSFV